MANVVRFNNEPLPDWVRVTGITFPALPEISHKEHASPSRYGNLDTGVDIGGKPFTLDVIILLEDGVTIHDRAQELKRWLKGSGWDRPSELVFEESPDHYYLARAVSSTDLNDLFLHGEGSIELKSSDGIRYDSSVSTKNVSGMSGNVEYSGQEVTPVEVEITLNQNVDDLAIVHEQSGKQIHLTSPLTSGQTIVIDCDSKQVTLDGEPAMRLLGVMSKWMYLEEGRNTFSIQSTTGSELALSTVISYRERN